MSQTAFVTLLKQHQTRIYRIAFYLLGNEEDAKDVTQETFVRAWQGFARLRIETADAWLTKTATNLCIDLLRKRKFHTASDEGPVEIELADAAPNPLELCLQNEVQAQVRRAIAQLPPAYRVTVILRDLEGLSYDEIAKALDMPLSTVKSNLFRGRRKLKEILRPYIEG